MAYLRANSQCPWYVYWAETYAKNMDDEVLTVYGPCWFSAKYSELKDIKTVEQLIELCKQKDKEFDEKHVSREDMEKLLDAIFRFIEDVQKKYQQEKNNGGE